MWAGTTDTVVEPDISVNITANQPSAWMLPLIGDIVIKGKSDVVLGDVNLTTNGGRVQLEQVTANLIAVDAGEIIKKHRLSCLCCATAAVPSKTVSFLAVLQQLAR